MLCKADAQPLYAIKWAYKKDKKMKLKTNNLNKQELINKRILNELEINKYLNQIEHALAGIRYEQSIKILCGIHDGKKMEIKISCNNKDIAKYTFKK